jgi:hypothetical protein
MATIARDQDSAPLGAAAFTGKWVVKIDCAGRLADLDGKSEIEHR